VRRIDRILQNLHESPAGRTPTKVALLRN